MKNTRIYKKVKEVFSQGLSTREIILATILGAIIGILPAFGISTVLVTFLSIRLGLNVGMAIVATYAFSVFQPFLFIPFIRIGEHLFGVEHTLLTYTAIKAAFLDDYLKALRDISLEFVCGISGWMLFALPTYLLLRQLSRKKPIAV